MVQIMIVMIAQCDISRSFVFHMASYVSIKPDTGMLIFK